MVRQLITDPNVFMERQVAKTKIRVEIIIVLLAGGLGIPGMYYVGQLILDASSSEAMQFAVAGRIIRPVMIVFLLWIGYAVALHFIAGHFRGRGAPRRLFKGIAWALIPLGIANIVQSIALYFVFRDVTVADELVGYTQAEQIQALLDSGFYEPIFVVSTVVVLAAILWSAYLMTFVVQHAKNIPREDAIKAVAIPVGIQVLFILWAFIQGSHNFATLL